MIKAGLLANVGLLNDETAPTDDSATVASDDDDEVDGEVCTLINSSLFFNFYLTSKRSKFSLFVKLIKIYSFTIINKIKQKINVLFLFKKKINMYSL